METSMTRRTFLQQSSLVIAAAVCPDSLGLFNVSPAFGAQDPTSFTPHAFLEIATNGTVTVWVGQTNLGQGTHTGIPMIIADELDADWKTVRVKAAPASEPFKDPLWHMQLTGGSTSIRHRWDLLRQVGAAARQMLRQAAAGRWGIPADQCVPKNGHIFHPDGRTVSYGHLALAAATLPVPGNPPLKNQKQYTIMGTDRSRFDIPHKVQGRTVYGMDLTLPGLCIAVVARPPAYGARLLSYDGTAALGLAGVIRVVPLENSVAVCAETTWAAITGRDALTLEWSEGKMPDLNDTRIESVYQDALNQTGVPALNTGDTGAALTKAGQIIEASYKLHYISHAQVEPMNCTAHVEKDRCRVWAPTQGATLAQITASKLTGLDQDKVRVDILPAGGGFGLRGEPDTVVEAVLLSKALNRPVKVVHTREDEFQNDYFRPANHSRIKAALDEGGNITAWVHKIAAQSIMKRIMPQHLENGVDGDAVSGVRDMPYALENITLDYVMVDLPVRVGWWRSVGYSINSFIVESFMDELAHAAGKDPLDFRLTHMDKGSRAYRVLAFLADKCGWRNPPEQGRARGIAVVSCFESHAAHMAELSVDPDGTIRVHKIVCAIDCGTAVYPDAIRAQAESAAVMALSVAFHEKISFADGGVRTANYGDYPLLTMSQVPEVDVHILPGNTKAGGIGEPVFPSVAPAVANAVFQATGVRLRELPFDFGLLGNGA